MNTTEPFPTDSAKEFFEQYFKPGEEMVATFVDDVESIQRCNEHLMEIAIAEELAAQHFAGLRFVG